MARRELGPDTVTVVLGASSGIGRASALRLARAGVRLVLVARSASSLDQVARACRTAGARSVQVFPLDITDADAVARMLTSLDREHGRIDLWVAASSVYSVGPFADLPEEVFRRVLEVNLLAQMDAVRRAIPLLRRRRGTIVFVSSVFAAVAAPLAVPYITSKHGLAGFAKALRLDLRGEVRVCSVLPASIDTPIYQHAANITGRRVRPLPPVVAPERVARAIVRVARRPRRRTIVGLIQGSAVYVRPMLPRTIDALMSAYMRRVGVSAEPLPPTDGTLFQPDEGSNAVDGGWRVGRSSGSSPAPSTGQSPSRSR